MKADEDAVFALWWTAHWARIAEQLEEAADKAENQLIARAQRAAAKARDATGPPPHEGDGGPEDA